MDYYFTPYLILFSARFVQLHLKSEQSPSTMYEGAQVWRSYLETASDVKLFNQLTDAQDLSVWHLSPEEAIFLVLPERKLKVHRLLTSHGLNHSVLLMDVQRRIDAQRAPPPVWDKAALRRGYRMEWGKYPTVEVIDEYLKYLADNYLSICKLEVIGYTEEKRQIKMMKVSNGNPNNKGFLLTAGIHAREWAAITSALIALREIVTHFDNQPLSMQNKDWYIIPLANPDGYHYSVTVDRFWRKNRRRNKFCIGVDLNRNFDKNFNISGVTKTYECNDAYSGPNAFSELETMAIRNMTLKIKDRLHAVIDLHTFGQLILYPWSSSPDPSPDIDLHNSTATAMCKALFAHQGQLYLSGLTYRFVYPASGSLMDWMYATGVRHSYVIEGRDRGVHGFLLPPHYIQEAGQEMLVAIHHLANTLDPEIKTAKKAKHRQRWL